MRATIVALGLVAGLFGTAGEASAQFGYGYPGYYGAYNPGVYGLGRGPFYGGRYYAAPVYGYGYPAFGAYNYGFNNFGYGGFPGYGFGGFPAYGGFGSGFRFGFSYGGFRY